MKIKLTFQLFAIIVACQWLSCSDKQADIQKIKMDPSSVKGVSGYFRVGQSTDGQWWFIDPDDNPFFYKGVCAVNRAGTQGGRRAMPGRYAVTIDDKYNYQLSPDSFVYVTFDKLRDMGFNALGAWATEEFFDRGVPYTEILEFFREPPLLPSNTPRRGLPDIFDPAWLVAIDIKARALCAPLRNSKDLVGYFTDNEIGFGRTDDFGLDPGFQADQFDFSLLRNILGMEEGQPAFEYAWNFLLERHGGSFEDLSTAWGVMITGPKDVKKINETKTQITGEAYADDAAAFSKRYAELYFQYAHDAIRRYDPNHLILGCRFGAPPPFYVLDAIKPYTDVISANNYRPTLYERYDSVYKHAGLPILIGEFSWNTDLFKRVRNQQEPAEGLPMKERMYIKGRSTLHRMAMHEGIIGYTWYRWVQPASTEERFTDGLVDHEDEYDLHVSELRKINPELDAIRISAAKSGWKQMAIETGEMTLFLDVLRPGWDPNWNITIGFKEGKTDGVAYGWQMKGSILDSHINDSIVSLSLQIEFDETRGRTRIFEPGNGTYEVILTKKEERLYGTFTGSFEGEPVTGRAKAYYFPEE